VASPITLAIHASFWIEISGGLFGDPASTATSWQAPSVASMISAARRRDPPGTVWGYVGMPVTVTYVDGTDDITLPYFVPLT